MRACVKREREVRRVCVGERERERGGLCKVGVWVVQGREEGVGWVELRWMVMGCG